MFGVLLIMHEVITRLILRPTLVCFGASTTYFALSLSFSFIRLEPFYQEMVFLSIIQFFIGLLLTKLINKLVYKGTVWALFSGFLYTLVVFSFTSLLYLLFIFVYSGFSIYSFHAFTLFPLVKVFFNTILILPFICLYMLFCNFFHGLKSRIERLILVLMYSLALCLYLYIIYYSYIL